PGSAFKAFLYAAAFEEGLSPGMIYVDEPVDIDGWTPQNYGGGFRGRMSLREAFKRSINTISAQIVAEIGPARVAELANRFGINRIYEPYPSIALGAEEVTLIELTGAYSVFAHGGERRSPYIIASLEDTRGETLYARPVLEPERVYDPSLTREMSGLMRGVVIDGTGQRANLRAVEVAGKTGTSQDSRDAWFIGFSSALTAGVWVGNDDDSPMEDVTGGTLPAEIWRRFMEAAHEGGEAEAIAMPEPTGRSPREEELALFYADLARIFGRIEAGGAR
ncbi:MAG: penicillin-binding protein, partial [Caulobacterales bacterium]|nr:penicillin-binding protein [Caulobacterales bacterium]